ncbi:MAG: glycine cleavage system protein GcvH [Gemmatimonadales bacterium]
MSNIPKNLRYTEDHEYVRAGDTPDVVHVGITDYAQGELGDVVFLDLPKPGATFGKKDVFGTIEAVKAVSELYCPVAGTVVETNQALEGDPALVNRDPYGEGWMIKLKLKTTAEVDGLLDADGYAKHIGE